MSEPMWKSLEVKTEPCGLFTVVVDGVVYQHHLSMPELIVCINGLTEETG